MEKLLTYRFLLKFIVVISTLMSNSDGLGPYISRRKLEKTWFLGKEMDGKLPISRQSRHFWFVNNLIEVLLPTLYIDLACKQFCFPQREK